MIVDLLDVPLVADGLDRTYAHLLLVVVVVTLLLTDEQFVAVTREIRWGFDDLIRSLRSGDRRCSRRCGRSFPRREFVLLRYCSFLSFLSILIDRVSSSGSINSRVLRLISRNNEFVS